MLKAFIAALFILSISSTCLATTRTAPTCGRLDVQNTVDASVSGDTVIIPSGTCKWTQVVNAFEVFLVGQVPCTTSPYTNYDGATIQVASACTTIIQDGIQNGSSGYAPLLQVGCFSANSRGGISNIEFDRGDRNVFDLYGIIVDFGVEGVGAECRVDHNYFKKLGGALLRGNDATGVWDHNTFEGPIGEGLSYILKTHNPSYGGDASNCADGNGCGDVAYSQPSGFGTNNFLFIEDNVIISDPTADNYTALDGVQGTRVVFRYNIISRAAPSCHGTETSGRWRSCRALEIYRNLFTFTRDFNAGGAELADMRGGTQLNFENSATNMNMTPAVSSLTADRLSCCSVDFGAADGTSTFDVNGSLPFFNGTTSSFNSGTLTVTVNGSPGWTTNQWSDGHYSVRNTTGVASGYSFSLISSNTANTLTFYGTFNHGAPLSFVNGDGVQITRVIEVIDGPGRVGGSVLANNVPTHYPSDTNNQTTEPMLAWSDYGDSVALVLSCYPLETYTCAAKHVDMQTSNCSTAVTGICVATNRSTRPGTCTAPSYWWSTSIGTWNTSGHGNQGTLDGCLTNNTWTNDVYHPYLYPNPLAIANYYIATNGDDSNSGTSLGSPFLTIQKCVTVVQPGGTCFVRSGTYDEKVSNPSLGGGLVIGSRYSADGTNYGFGAITLKPYNGETVLIQNSHFASDFILTFIGGTDHYWILDCGGTMAFDGSNQTRVGSSPSGLIDGAGGYVRFNQCEVENGPSSGFDPGGNYWEFNDLDVHDNGRQVGSVQFHGVYWTGNNAIFSGGSYHDNWGYGIQIFNSGHTDVSNNTVYNASIYGNDRRNDGSGGMVLASGSNNLAFNNLIYSNDAGPALQMDFNSTDGALYNNTIYGNPNECIQIGVGGGTTGTIVKNNICYQNGSDISDHGTGTVASNNLTMDPSFVDVGASNFMLQAGSAAIEFGANLTSLSIAALDLDITGNQRPAMGAWTVGGYNYTAPGSIVSVTPNVGSTGGTYTLAIVGSGTTWSDGTTALSFAVGPSVAGITVNSTTCSNTTHCSSSITIDSNASTGLRNVYMTTGSEVETSVGGFTVTSSMSVGLRLKLRIR